MAMETRDWLGHFNWRIRLSGEQNNWKFLFSSGFGCTTKKDPGRMVELFGFMFPIDDGNLTRQTMKVTVYTGIIFSPVRSVRNSVIGGNQRVRVISK